MFICIEGNIGAGKTTLAKKIADELKFDFLPEQFEENSLLPLFYNDPKTYSYLLEFSFLIERFQQLNNWAEKLKTKHVVSDYNFYKCLCFAKINLSEPEYNFFEKELDVSKMFDTLVSRLQDDNIYNYYDPNIAYPDDIKKTLNNYREIVEFAINTSILNNSKQQIYGYLERVIKILDEQWLYRNNINYKCFEDIFQILTNNI